MVGFNVLVIRTIVPTILAILFNYFHFLKYRSKKEIMIGLVGSLITSFFTFYSIARSLTALCYELTKRINPSVNASVETIEAIIIFTIMYFIFEKLYCLLVAGSDLHSKKKHFSYGFFIYTQYLIINYLSLIFALTDWMVPVVQLILCIIWIHIFYKELHVLVYIYPENKLSPINICLVMEHMFVLFFWTAPLLLMETITGHALQLFSIMLTLLAAAFYVFVIVIQKLMFHEAYHEYREIKSISTDDLTGLTSRVYFLNKAQNVLNTREDGKKIDSAFIFFNLADFKYYNEHHGKFAADTLLIQIAELLSKIFGPAAGISRLSDDHFVVITPQLDSIVERIEAINMALSQDFGTIHLKAGIYLTNEGDNDVHLSIDNAKLACDSIKHEQDTLYKYFDADNARALKLSHYVIDNIDRAATEELLTVYYQPIMDVSTGDVTGYEALIRWFDDTFGFLPPDEFIPTLEAKNLTYKVDRFVIEHVCKDIKRLRSQGKPVIPIAINLSRKDFFNDFDIIAFLDNTTAKYEVEHSLIKIEITESAFTGDSDHIRNCVRQLREEGYNVWMDDFGSGYSSLNMLGTFEFDGIKLDMVFLRNMTTTNRFIIQSIINSTKALGLSVLMEGVETEEHYAFLKEVGCDSAQGYLLGKPAPIDQ